MKDKTREELRLEMDAAAARAATTATAYDKARAAYAVSRTAYRKKLKEISHRIHRILVDECHSIEIQSSFRYNLRDFDYNVGKYLTDHTSIVSVTASPNLGTPINIEIDNRYVDDTLINVCYNFEASIERIKQLMEDEQRVIIFTNNKNIPYIIRNEDDEVHADEADHEDANPEGSDEDAAFDPGREFQIIDPEGIEFEVVGLDGDLVDAHVDHGCDDGGEGAVHETDGVE